MSVALKNDIDQISSLCSIFDFALNEECFDYDECGDLATYFVKNNKAVFQMEYDMNTSSFCPQAISAHYNSLKSDLDLSGGANKRTPCIPDNQDHY
jgi:hypothetical protein